MSKAGTPTGKRGIYRRNNTLYARIVIPSDLREFYDTSEVWRTLQTNDLSIAQKQHERLLTVIQAGSYIDPIQVIRTASENTEEFLVFDGHHRLLAYQELKQPSDTIKVELLGHSLQDALKLGYTVNATHGAALRDKERTHACFRSLLFCHDEIPTKDLQVHGIGERLAQKLKQAAKLLKSEADVYPNDNADQILKKIQAWTRAEIKRQKEGITNGKPTFLRDEHLIPSYRYVLDRKPANVEESEGVKLARMIDQMKVYVQNDPDLFRKAIKKLSRDYDLQIRVKNMKLEVDGSEEKQNGRSPNEVTSIIENLEF